VRRFAKPLKGVNLFRGFESLPLRHRSARDRVTGARSSVDRALGCGPKGRRFESSRARQHLSTKEAPAGASRRVWWVEWSQNGHKTTASSTSGDPRRGIGLHPWHRMRVQVERHGHGRVTKALLNHLRVDASRQREGRMRVPKIMQSDDRQREVTDEALEPAAHRIGEAVQAAPQLWISAEATSEEKDAARRAHAAAALANLPPQPEDIHRPRHPEPRKIPQARRMLAVETFWVGPHFVKAGMARDVDDEVVRLAPQYFKPAIEPDEAA
jgi:hypothetical protein